MERLVDPAQRCHGLRQFGGALAHLYGPVRSNYSCGLAMIIFEEPTSPTTVASEPGCVATGLRPTLPLLLFAEATLTVYNRSGYHEAMWTVNDTPWMLLNKHSGG